MKSTETRREISKVLSFYVNNYEFYIDKTGKINSKAIIKEALKRFKADEKKKVDYHLVFLSFASMMVGLDLFWVVGGTYFIDMFDRGPSVKI